MRIGFPGLGDSLRLARDEAGLSQEAVAEKVGVSWMTVHRWEHGQRTISAEKLNRLGEIYGKNVRWFLTLEEGDLEAHNGQYAVARRLYRRIAEAPERYQVMIERVVTNILEGVEGTDRQP